MSNDWILAIWGTLLAAILLYLRFSKSEFADKFRSAMTLSADEPMPREGDIVDICGLGNGKDCKMRIVKIGSDRITLEKP